MILPALTEATNPFLRPIKYSLFPPLRLATLAAYLSDDDDVTICDKHVEKLRLNDEPDLVVVQVYITGGKDLCPEMAARPSGRRTKGTLRRRWPGLRWRWPRSTVKLRDRESSRCERCEHRTITRESEAPWARGAND